MTRDITYFIVIAALLFASLFFYNRTQTLKERNQDKDSIISEKNDSLRYTKNENGRIVAEKNAAIASSREIAKAYPQLEKELKEDFAVKIKNLRTYIRSEILAQGQGKATVINNYHIDSTGNKIEYRDVKFNDGYLTFESSIFEGLDFGDSKYSYADTISTVISVKKKWFLGNEKFYASSMLRNPNAKVINSTSILIDNVKDKRFCVYVGPGYDFLNNQVTLNVGVGYALIKF